MKRRGTVASSAINTWTQFQHVAGCAKTVCTDDSTGALTNQNTLNYELCGIGDRSARVYVMSPRFVCSWSHDYYYMEKNTQQK